MTFSSLIKRLSKEHFVEVLSQESDLEIENLAFIDNKHNIAFSNTLYFGYDTQLENIESTHLSCILVRSEKSVPIAPGGSNIALIKPTSLFDVFNDAKDLIESTCQKGIFEELTKLADSTHDIESIINAASIRLGNCLLFCDMNFKIIASSTTIPVNDPLWSENSSRGYCSYEFINEVKELVSVKNAALSTSTIEVTCTQSPYRKLSSKVFHNQTQIGFLLMIGQDSPILPSHFEMLSTISHVLSYSIACYMPELFGESTIYQELLYNLLIGTPSKNITTQLKNLVFPPQMTVLFIHPTRYLGQQYLNNFTYRYLKKQIPEAHFIYHKKGIVILAPAIGTMQKDLLAILEEICRKEHMRIGISNSFTNIKGFLNGYEQAHTALDFAYKLKTKDIICQYPDYQIFHLLSNIKKPENLGYFCHPALSQLRQYDQKNNAELYKTLYVFIENRCNIKLTSESLYIHRNSLVYRLNRITELCQIDFTDVNTVFLLRFSFLIECYNEYGHLLF